MSECQNKIPPVLWSQRQLAECIAFVDKMPAKRMYRTRIRDGKWVASMPTTIYIKMLPHEAKVLK